MARIAAFVIGIVLATATVYAQEIGTIAESAGSAEIGQGGAWAPASIGAPVHLNDQIRTGQPGRVRIVFQDDSVLNVSDNSQITVDTQVFDPKAGKSESVLSLLKGKVDAVVSEYYHNAGSSYRIKTVTAVAGVRGTEFLMTYDPETTITEVVGVSGRVEVHSALDPFGPGVFITAREATTIAPGELPTAPRRTDDNLFRQDLEGLNFIGAGRPESLAFSGPALSAGPAPQKVQVDTLPAPGQNRQNPDPSSVVGQPTSIINRGRLGIRF